MFLYLGRFNELLKKEEGRFKLINRLGSDSDIRKIQGTWIRIRGFRISGFGYPSRYSITYGYPDQDL